MARRLVQIKVSTTFNHLGEVKKGLRQGSKKAVRDLGRAVVEDAQIYARRKTGAYAASIYWKTDIQNGYEKAIATAKALKPKAEFWPDIPPVTNELELMVAIGVKYGGIVHDGNASRMPNPVVTDALNKFRAEFSERVAARVNEEWAFAYRRHRSR